MSAFTLRLAIIPSLLLLLFVVGRNKKRRNPTSLLVWLAVLGAVSAIPACIIGEGVLYGLGFDPESVTYAFIENFCIIAMIEELGKFLGMILLTWKNKNFDHSYDGVIYGVCSTLGFATFENVLYVYQGGIGTGVMRAFSAVPLHCACGVIMGFFYAKAREHANQSNGSGAFANFVLAYVCPLGLHGLYDFVIEVDDSSLLICLAVVALIIALLFLMISHAAKEDHIIAVQPIWTDPYSFRYMPMRGSGRANNYSQPNGYDQQPNQYGQPNSYGQQPNQYSQPNSYGQPANQYGQQSSYGQSNSYGQQANQYSQQSSYGQANSYGQQANQYSQQSSYGRSNSYSQQQNQYSQSNNYGQQHNQYNQQSSYGQSNNYGQQANQYNQPNSYGQQANQYNQPSSYGQQANQYNQPSSYSQQSSNNRQADQYNQPNSYGQSDNRN